MDLEKTNRMGIMNRFLIAALLSFLFALPSNAQSQMDNCDCLSAVREQLAEIAKQYAVNEMGHSEDSIGNVNFITLSVGGIWVVAMNGKRDEGDFSMKGDFLVEISPEGKVTRYLNTDI